MKYLSIRRLSKICGITVRRIRFLIRTRDIPAVKAGGKWLIAVNNVSLIEKAISKEMDRRFSTTKHIKNISEKAVKILFNRKDKSYSVAVSFFKDILFRFKKITKQEKNYLISHMSDVFYIQSEIRRNLNKNAPMLNRKKVFYCGMAVIDHVSRVCEAIKTACANTGLRPSVIKKCLFKYVELIIGRDIPIKSLKQAPGLISKAGFSNISEGLLPAGSVDEKQITVFVFLGGFKNT